MPIINSPLPEYGSTEHAQAITEDRHPGIRDGLQWLTFTHLPEALQGYSMPFYEAAVRIIQRITTDSPELTTALNGLIAGKDSAVRAGIRHDTGRAGSVPRPQAVVDPPKLATPAAFDECRAPTPDGLCLLRSGHPVGPIYPGHNGHMAASRYATDPPQLDPIPGDEGCDYDGPHLAHDWLNRGDGLRYQCRGKNA